MGIVTQVAEHLESIVKRCEAMPEKESLALSDGDLAVILVASEWLKKNSETITMNTGPGNTT